MAEAFARMLSDEHWDIWSAGSHPSGTVHPLAIELMRERGLSLQSHRSKGLEALPRGRWEYVVTMGCGDQCPTVEALHRLSWDIPDPVALPREAARRVRDQIEQRVRELLATVSSAASHDRQSRTP